MQFYANKNRLPLKTILFFAAVLFIAYLPVSSFLFFLKNDAFTGYFPPKFFMSESIHAGQLPLWNPYINFGIPQYGDMSSGYWSPITWLIASTTGYNAYTFTIEVLLYILIGGLGMYKLCRYLQLNKQVCLIGAVAFMCCGYNVGHLQHFNWLSGAAFLPWCCWSYNLLLNTPSFKNIVRAVLLFYLLVASAHPGITISAFYFFAAYAVFYFFQDKEPLAAAGRIKKISTSHLLFIALFLLLSAGMITGYLDILPHFARGEKISLADALLHPATPQSWISVLLPFTTVKNDALFHTDVSMRNSYFSCTLLLFFLTSLFSKKNKLQLFLLFAGLFFLLLSSGGIFKTIAYKCIPFIGYVRLNGEFRIFAIFSFILIAAIELNNHITKQQAFAGTVKWLYYTIEVLVIAAIIFGLCQAVSSKESILWHKSIGSQTGLSSRLKAFIDGISFYDTLWMQGFVQLFVLWGIKWCLRFQNRSLLKKIVVADMILASLFNIPFTGVGKASVAQVQQVLNKSPKGIPVPKLIPINTNDSATTDEKNMVGDWSFYNKQPGTVHEGLYPIVLKNTVDYFEHKAMNPALAVDSRPILFTAEVVSDSTAYHIYSTFGFKLYDPVIRSYTPSKISLAIKTEPASNIVYLQNYYPHWYYNNGKEQLPVKKAVFNFMMAPISEGANSITFSFEPTFVKWAMLVSAMVFILLCLVLIFPRKEAKET